VEVIAGAATDRGVELRLLDFYAGIDKIPIAVRDCPGFAVNRFFVPWLNEAVRVYEEGRASIADIDAIACREFGIGMGPFALMNATGVPIAQHAAHGLAAVLGAFYAPADRLVQQVESGRPWDLQEKSGGQADEDLVKRRLLAAALGCAAAVVSEGSTDASSVDLGARAGLSWRAGPFEMINRHGVRKVRDMVKALFTPWGLPPPDVPFTGEAPVPLCWVSTERHAGSGFVVLNIPDRMNALSEAVMRQLAECFDKLEADPQVAQIAFVGTGKAFVAGADIRFFLDAMEAGDIQRIVDFTAFGQALFKRINAAKKPTLAYIDGLALGGGLELALACRYRWATHRARLGLPETGIGIYPGLGGTQRLPRLIGKGLAKRLIATGQIIGGEKALAWGLVDHVMDRVAHWRELARMDFAGHQASPGAATEEAVFADFDGVLDRDWLASEAAKPFSKALSRKAPHALCQAMSLVDRGFDLTLEQGLDLEVQGLTQAFQSDEARIGLQSVLTRKPPEFARLATNFALEREHG